MTVEDLQMYCRHCWNPVERILYREEGKRTVGDVENVWKHSAHGQVAPLCITNPITDEDVIPEHDLP